MLLLASALLVLSTSWAAEDAVSGRTLQETNFISHTSIPWDAARGLGSQDIPVDDPLLPKDEPGLAPDQVHLTFVNGTAVSVSWATGDGVAFIFGRANTSAANAQNTQSVVQFGTKSGALDRTAKGTTTSYATSYTGFVNETGYHNNNPTYNYSSPLFHHVLLSNLAPSTTYFYRVGEANDGGQSQEFTFTTMPPPGTYPFALGVVADLGQTYNSSTTMQHLAASEPLAWILVGDFTYADEYTTNGTLTWGGFPNNTYLRPFEPFGSFQPRWDSWFRLIQSFASRVPLIPNHGNHELEPQGDGHYAAGLDGGRQFTPYISRIPVPYQGSGSPSPLYYSVDVGPAHLIQLTNYDDWAPGSPQHQWLVKDLATYNRTKTPWLVANWHAPWYSSYTKHYKETECMRQAMEDLLYDAGVDLVLAGHLHEYERTNPVLDYKVDACGPVHITVGAGGNVEGLYQTFIDQPGPGNCPPPDTLPFYQPGPYCPSFPFNTSNQFAGYCPTTGQPDWSAFREPAFGHGLLTFVNNTHALWQWNRNQDDQSVNLDEVYLIQNPARCPNQPYPRMLNATRNVMSRGPYK
ncbi:hypothetical protein WJX72_010710 [[Myrmecia] bisecta]|uniref:Purple acid phosphatase n=1 Tax=[Myrmecia] bisecta TaxID=41462 RepID=A0AAW1QSI4_9CHLO